MHFAIVYYSFVHILLTLAPLYCIVFMCLNNCVHQQNETLHMQNINQVDVLDSDVINNCDYLEHDDFWVSENTELFVLQWNIRGMYSKQDQIKHLIDNKPCKRCPGIVLLCETWLSK